MSKEIRDFKIKINDKENAVEISANKATRKRIIELLIGKDCHCELRRSLTRSPKHSLRRSFLILDYRALEILQKNHIPIHIADISLEAQKENLLINELAAIFSNNGDEKKGGVDYSRAAAEYINRQRVWFDRGKYFTKIGSDIYSCNTLQTMVELIDGEYLIESNKPLPVNRNLLKLFGVVDVAHDLTRRNKSVFHLTTDGGLMRIKKKYETLISNGHLSQTLLDGIDDAVDALSNISAPQQAFASLPLQTSGQIQALLVWPFLLRGANFDLENLWKDAKNIKNKYLHSSVEESEIQNELKQFREKLCEIVGLNYIDFQDQTTQQLMDAINAKLTNELSDVATRDSASEKIGQITSLCNEYEISIAQKSGIPNLTDVIAAYSSWFVTVAIMLSTSIYEMQAIGNAVGTTSTFLTGTSPVSAPTTSMGLANLSGLIGLSMLSAYAFYKCNEERKSWKQVEKELKKFQNVKDVSSLASKITGEILNAKKIATKQKHLLVLSGAWGKLLWPSEALEVWQLILCFTLGLEQLWSALV